MLKALMLVVCLMSVGCVSYPVPAVMRERLSITQQSPYNCPPQIEFSAEVDYTF